MLPLKLGIMVRSRGIHQTDKLTSIPYLARYLLSSKHVLTPFLIHTSIMAKSRNFSVYLLKREFNADNALKDEINLTRLTENDTKIPEGGVMYVGQSPIKQPWWKEYWGINQELKQSSASAIVFLPVNDRWFAITFGASYHNLKEKAYEYDFGIRTTLNSLDPEKIKSTDLLIPETAKRQRIQIPNASNLTYFDFNKDESIVKRLTGAVKDEYADLIRNATGSSNLRFATVCEPDELIDLCSRLLEIYSRTDYEESFPDLQNITPIKDPDLIASLETKLLEEYRDCTPNLTLAIPEIVDYTTNYKFKYRGASRMSEEYDDVFIGNYRNYLTERGVEVNDVSLFNKHTLNVFDENGQLLRSYSIYKSLLFDCTLNGKTYRLCEGSWYEISSDFMAKLKAELDPVFIDHHDVLCECNKKLEGDYNIEASNLASAELEVCCLDKTSIAPQGQKDVEPCDLIALNGENAELMHNKISTRSSMLSHLFNQGVNSVILLMQNNESKVKLNDLVESENLRERINRDNFHVTYGIISNKRRDMKSDALPIFSRISLLRCVRNLKLMRVPVSVYLIKDNVDRKHLNDD